MRVEITYPDNIIKTLNDLSAVSYTDYSGELQLIFENGSYWLEDIIV